MIAYSPFIHSAYSFRVCTSASGSTCAENVASGAQKALQASQPPPLSHASKKALAVSVIVDSVVVDMRHSLALATAPASLPRRPTIPLARVGCNVLRIGAADARR